MDRVVKFSGVVLWSIVFMTAEFSYTAINYFNDLKWINSCAGWVMVEMKSHVFEKKLQEPQIK